MEERQTEAHDLLETATSEPETVDLDAVVDLLSVEDSTTRNVALKALGAVAHRHPDRAASVSEPLIASLDDPFPVASNTATIVLGLIAGHSPDVVRAVPSLIGKLNDEVPQYRFHAAGAIAAVSEGYPEAFVTHSDDLFDFLVGGPRLEGDESGRSDGSLDAALYGSPRQRVDTIRREQQTERRHSQSTREMAAAVLVRVARIAPEVCARRLTDIVTLLEDDAAPVQVAAIEIITHIAENNPAAVEPGLDALIERLDEDVALIRMWAIEALGTAGATGAIDELYEVADTDPDEEVADYAAEIVDTLSETD